MDQLPFILTIAALIGLGLIEALFDSRAEAKTKALADQDVPAGENQPA